MTPQQTSIIDKVGAALQSAIDGLAQLLATDTPTAEPTLMDQFAAFMTAQGKGAVASRAKTDTGIRAALPRAAGSRLGVPIGPAKVYVAMPGYDRKLAKAQTAINGKVVQMVIAAGKAGIAARTVATKGHIKPKSVQSAMYALRHMGLVQSVPVKA